MKSFKNYKFLFLGVLSLLMALLYFALSPEQYEPIFPKCPIYHGLGIYCTGCGSQRALHDLVHFRLGEAFSHNLLLIPTLMVVVLHLGNKVLQPSKKSILDGRWAPLIILGVLLLFTVLRNIDVVPFSYLAP